MFAKVLFVSVLVLGVASYYTNIQARACIDSLGTDMKCFKVLSNCFDDETCLKEYKTYEKCRIDEDHEIFNGYCFRKWQEDAVYTKDVINCLVEHCNLTFNSLTGIREFYDCSRTVLESYGEALNCEADCLKEFQNMKACLKIKPYNDCYDIENQPDLYTNPEALRILRDIRQECLVKPQQIDRSQ